jgi:hypothetical protein
MFKRRNTLLLIGVVMVVIGATLFFVPVQSKAVWLLSVISFYLGGSLAFIGATIRLFE